MNATFDIDLIYIHFNIDIQTFPHKQVSCWYSKAWRTFR